MDYVRVYENGLEDFRDLILSDVWEDLFQMEDFEDYDIVMCGAVDDNGIPVGAAVGKLLENRELYILSIFVDEAYRRKGVGKGLVNGLMKVALEEFVPGDVEYDSVDMFIHTESVLPADEMHGFHAFLENVGFSDFEKKENVFLLDAEDLREDLDFNCIFKEDFQPNPNCFALSEAIADETEEEAIQELIDSYAIDCDPEYLFVLGDGSVKGEELKNAQDMKLKMLVGAMYGNDYDFYVFSHIFEENLSDVEYLDTTRALVGRIAREYPEFSLIASSEQNAKPLVWARLGELSGLVCERLEAGMYAVIE